MAIDIQLLSISYLLAVLISLFFLIFATSFTVVGRRREDFLIFEAEADPRFARSD